MASVPPTQQRILDLLSDGKPHRRLEIRSLLWDELSHPHTIRKHISLLRKYVRPQGREIVCELFQHGICYRLVVLLGTCSCSVT